MIREILATATAWNIWSYYCVVIVEATKDIPPNHAVIRPTMEEDYEVFRFSGWVRDKSVGDVVHSNLFTLCYNVFEGVMEAINAFHLVVSLERPQTGPFSFDIGPKNSGWRFSGVAVIYCLGVEESYGLDTNEVGKATKG